LLGLAAAARSPSPSGAPSPIDYEKEIADIVACAGSKVLPAQVTLLPSDSDEGITVSRSVACFMRLVQSVAEEDDSDNEDDEQQEKLEIPLAKVDAESLALIVEFAEKKLAAAGPELDGLKFSEVPRPLSGPLSETESISEEDATFMDEIANDLDKLFRLTNAVNFVDCPPLLELCTARIAQMLIGKTPKEIREIFPEVFKKEAEAAEE